MRQNYRLWPVLALGLTALLAGCGGAAEADPQAALALKAAQDDATAQRAALDQLIASRSEASTSKKD